jgi:hypothetical protein
MHFTLFIHFFAVVTLVYSSCEYRLERSPSSGMGLFATREIEPFEILEKSIGVPIPIRVILWNQLIHYVEGLNGTHALLALGVGMMLNHAHRMSANVRKVQLYTDGQIQFRSPYQSSIDLIHEYQAYIDPGEQLLVDYGDGWFEDHHIPYMDLTTSKLPSIIATATTTTTTTLEHTSHEIFAGCIDFWTKFESGKLVASRFIPEGTVIELVRGLLIPITTALLTSGPLEELVWWPSISHEYLSLPATKKIDQYPPSPYDLYPYGHDDYYVILFSGKAAFYSPVNKDDLVEEEEEEMANIRYQWISTNSADHTTQTSAESAEREVTPLKTSQDRILCEDLILMQFVASRNIMAGEILTVPHLYYNNKNKYKDDNQLIIDQSYRRVTVDPIINRCLQPLQYRPYYQQQKQLQQELEQEQEQQQDLLLQHEVKYLPTD